jgi:aminopeptidase N
MNSIFSSKLLSLMLLVICAGVQSPRAEERFIFQQTPGKLPKHVLPRHYELELKPDLDSFTVSGHESIEIEVTKATRQVILNTHELQITAARFVSGPALTAGLDSTNQLFTLTAANEINPGKYQLELAFAGKITESASGMFVLKYVAPSGDKMMVATQFEATDARRTFPCFDEPSFRATFTLTAEVPESIQAVSNMPVDRTEPSGSGWKRVRFQRTPPMPTYLLVLVAGELEEIHGRAGKIETRIWFTEGKQEQARYALENSKRLLAFYNDYFGVRFPLPKLDHIAMPGGFGGAMEHWGSITYNEGTILYDPKKSSHDQKEQAFGIMAHEMAHQWFGNLVTMAWWDNLWLNEGFASWMASKTTDTLNPDWNTWVRVDAQKLGLMARDARKSTHPIQRPVVSESQIGDAFDDITYEKGMFFIRMLEDYVGERKFRDGLRHYMKVHAYSNTTTADLWSALAESSHKPVAEFAAGWTEQPGLPVIIATSHCSAGKQELDLRQERYTLLDPVAAPLRWKVPVNAMIVGRKNSLTQTIVENDPVLLKLGACDEAIKLNAGSRGYYRVSYDRAMFQRLRGNWQKLTEADHVSFLGDVWSMIESGKLSADEYLDIIPTLARETSLAVWEQTLGTISLIDHLLQAQNFRADFQKRVVALIHPLLVQLGYHPRPGEHASDSVLRARLFSLLGALDDPEIVSIAKQRFEDFRQDQSTLTGDLRAAVLSVVGEHAKADEYEQLKALAKDAALEEDRRLFLNALVQVRDANMARRTLELSLTGDFPPVQSATIVSGVSSSGIHAQAAWDFMKQHHRELMALVQGPFENMYAGSTVSGFSDEAHAAEYVEFIRANYPPDALTKAEEAADQIRYVDYLKRQILPAVEKWTRR